MKLLYCSECASPLTKQDNTHYVCQQGHPCYNNPRAAAGIVLIDSDNKVLFVQRSRDPKKNLYGFPGGFVDYGEKALQGAVRELQEETGAIAQNPVLIDVVYNQYEENVCTIDTYFATRTWEGTLGAGDDVLALAWYEPEFLLSEQFAWKKGYETLYDNIMTYIKETT